MCASIKTLLESDPPATGLELIDTSLQFVRKPGGFHIPSWANAGTFDRAVADRVAAAVAVRVLIASLRTAAGPRAGPMRHRGLA